VLLLGVGSVTRLLRYLTALGKTYTAEIVLGSETNTLDSSGTVLATYDMAPVSLEAARLAAATLTGPIMQIPPMVSAVQIDGRRLHELARAGIEVERQPRPVTVHRFEVQLTEDPSVLACEVECSSGTYVRSLAADLGTALGGGAHLRNLRRTAVGSFTVAEAHGLDDLALLSPAEALRDYRRVTVDDEVAALVRNGRILDPFDGEGPWAVCDEHGELLAMYETHGDRAKPAVVLTGLSPGPA
jgi:tRNA pseudouridine55 synthase